MSDRATQKTRIAALLVQKCSGAEISRRLRIPAHVVYTIIAEINREKFNLPQQQKPCEYCDAPVRRRYNEGKKDWAKRKFCSSSCSAKAQKIKYRAAHPPKAAEPKAIKTQSKHCQQCGGAMVRGYRECTRDWLSRRFCGQQCNISSRTVTPRPDQVKRLFDPLPGRMFAIYDRIIAERSLNDWREAAVLCGMRA